MKPAGASIDAVHAMIDRRSEVNATVADYHLRNPGRFASDAALAAHLRGAARRRAFRIWLEQRRAALVWLAPGYEHPGDPRQPDNTHRH